MSPSTLELGAAVLSLLVLKLIFFPARKLPSPPGPKGLPLVGNVNNYPPFEEWVVFRDLGEQYNSDIIQYTIFGETIIVVNTIDAANELFIKRSAIYSDRPDFPMLNDIVGFTWHFAFQRYSDNWRLHRKMFHHELEGPILAARQHPHIIDAVRFMLQRIIDNPNNYVQEFRLYAGKVSLRVNYGIDIREDDDPFILSAEKGMNAMAVAGLPGVFWVDQWPILRFIPPWMPGASFQKWGKDARIAVDAMRDAPLKHVEDGLATGTAKPCIASKVLSQMEEDSTDSHENRVILGNVLASSYAAGSDTVVAALSTCVLALVQNPAFLQKAQAQIDHHTGQNRLPDLTDRQAMPYIEALLKETLRWKLVTPLGVPHRVTEDDVYRGYHIPKGATVIGNSWAILHDKTVYGTDADEFNPQRFLLPDGTLNESIPHPTPAFGFGRRICVGQHIAEDTLWSGIASMVAAFNITKAVDKYGRVIEPSGEYTSGLLSHPKAFECSFTPRSAAAEDLVRGA